MTRNFDCRGIFVVLLCVSCFVFVAPPARAQDSPLADVPADAIVRSLLNLTREDDPELFGRGVTEENVLVEVGRRPAEFADAWIAVAPTYTQCIRWMQATRSSAWLDMYEIEMAFEFAPHMPDAEAERMLVEMHRQIAMCEWAMRNSMRFTEQRARAKGVSPSTTSPFYELSKGVISSLETLHGTFEKAAERMHIQVDDRYDGKLLLSDQPKRNAVVEKYTRLGGPIETWALTIEEAFEGNQYEASLGAIAGRAPGLHATADRLRAIRDLDSVLDVRVQIADLWQDKDWFFMNAFWIWTDGTVARHELNEMLLIPVLTAHGPIAPDQAPLAGPVLPLDGEIFFVRIRY